MAEYVLIEIESGDVVKFTNSDRQSANFPSDVSHKGIKWHPVQREDRPAYDETTHNTPIHSDGLVGDNYVLGWAEQPKSNAEKAAFKARADKLIANEAKAIADAKKASDEAKAVVQEKEDRLLSMEARLDALEVG